MPHPLFVDLPNFYSHLLESGVDTPRILRDYFLEWFDFDRLAESLTGHEAPVWVFYSGRKFGPRENRVEGAFLDKFISRINQQRGVTAKDVNIPGEQRETIVAVCPNCSERTITEHLSEKGIDASLTVHLFDTMDGWSKAYLLSGDADFVPCVASLRRRGKIVVGAGFTDSSPALVRECYDYIDLIDNFFREDVAIYNTFKKNGIIDQWLYMPVSKIENLGSSNISLGIEINDSSYTRSNLRGTNVLNIVCYANMLYQGPIDIGSRKTIVEDFQRKFPEILVVKDRVAHQEYSIRIHIHSWIGFQRRFKDVLSWLNIPGLHTTADGAGYFIVYEQNASGEYKPNK